MRCPHSHVLLGLAVLQIADTIVGAIPSMSTAARLDHLGFPEPLRPLLPLIKMSASVGLVAGLRRPQIGVVTSAALVAFYATAVGFHRLAGDRLVAALPAAACGAVAALGAVRPFPPATRKRRPA
jgi:hypothetical protein